MNIQGKSTLFINQTELLPVDAYRYPLLFTRSRSRLYNKLLILENNYLINFCQLNTNNNKIMIMYLHFVIIMICGVECFIFY